MLNERNKARQQLQQLLQPLLRRRGVAAMRSCPLSPASDARHSDQQDVALNA